MSYSIGHSVFRRSFCGALLLVIGSGTQAIGADQKPNFVVIFCDDLGYGDIGPFGHPTIATPNLDRMAREGMRLTQFYAAACVCTPSRAGLMTGRLPIRNGMCHDRRRVLFPDSQGGLPADEITIAELLHGNGYATGCIGKWHLGHLPRYLPTSNGFDSYLGIPYSNDMDRLADSPKGREAFANPKIEYFNVPLMRDQEIVERPADQTTITRRYTEEAVRFIDKNKDRPFFLYFPHSLPHVPLFRSPEFADTSRRGLFGDVVEEIDWSVGQVLDALRERDLDENTLVFFTSDNGPWLIFGEHGGSAGLLKDGKGCTWEGGMREPTLAWWPGKIAAGKTSTALGSTMDLMATVCSLSSTELPADRTLDTHDLSPVLLGRGESTRNSILYYRGTQLMAARLGPWKAHFITQSAYGGGKPETHDPPLLFQLEHDPSERHNVAADHRDVLAEINDLVAKHREGLVVAKSQLGP
ncbi:MAG: sulfatase [Planctomycetales bacterium]|nr:sulfatase [Planctomycetales bacterium]